MKYPNGRPWLKDGPINERLQCPSCGIKEYISKTCECNGWDLSDAASEQRERAELKRLKNKYE